MFLLETPDLQGKNAGVKNIKGLVLLSCSLLFHLRFSSDELLKPFINSYNCKKQSETWFPYKKAQRKGVTYKYDIIKLVVVSP